mmetsp:Transcript_62891/g.164922  ORF Transcript_62891/g.164922 Transcript_62891/m.164922 type:complete len:244 (+) Transcript_62891:809-1540(+)
MSAWYAWRSFVLCSVSIFCASVFSSMFCSLSAIRSFRPSPGELMSRSRPVIALPSSPRDLVSRSTLSLLSERSLSHHPSCFASALPSSTISPNMLSIWRRTSSNGLSASSMASTLISFSDLSLPHALWRSAWTSALGLLSAECLRICRKLAALVAPLAVASALPNVSKAESLLRMAIASETAESSLARIMFRSLYCSAFALHVGSTSPRKSSSVAFSFFASFSVSFLVPRLPSLAPIVRCFFW